MGGEGLVADLGLWGWGGRVFCGFRVGKGVILGGFGYVGVGDGAFCCAWLCRPNAAAVNADRLSLFIYLFIWE